MAETAQSFHDLSIDERLQIVNRGTSYFSGQLAHIDNEDFGEPTLLPDWDRFYLVAHVGYNARALVNLVNWASTGVETPMYSSPKARGEEIARGATLPPGALRNLHSHSVVQLNVAWRDCPREAWDAEVKTAQGRTVPMSETLWMRTREVWLHAVDLDVNGRFSDIPHVVLATLVPEIVGKWRKGELGDGLVLVNSETGERWAVTEGHEETEVTGTLTGLARWASGRGGAGVNADAPEPPHWL